MVARKDAVVKQNNDGILYLFKKNKVTFFHGRGSFAKAVDGGYEIAVQGAGAETLRARHVIVATGRMPARCRRAVRRGAHPLQRWRRAAPSARCPSARRDRRRRHRPEMGSVWRRLGAEVTVPRRCPTSPAPSTRASPRRR